MGCIPTMGEGEPAIQIGNKVLRRAAKKKIKGDRSNARCFG